MLKDATGCSLDCLLVFLLVLGTFDMITIISMFVPQFCDELRLPLRDDCVHVPDVLENIFNALATRLALAVLIVLLFSFLFLNGVFELSRLAILMVFILLLRVVPVMGLIVTIILLIFIVLLDVSDSYAAHSATAAACWAPPRAAALATSWSTAPCRRSSRLWLWLLLW